MKISPLLTTTAISTLLAFSASASAEQYQGVLKLESNASRAEVQREAMVAAHSADPYREGASAGIGPFIGHRDRATVRAEALAAARAGNIYSDGSIAFATPPATTQADRQAVRAEARATAARGVTEGTL
ncbi:helicase SNF2 [Variovorax saccharolyticus]|uniref:helicase SNF2 n=1 Tax=Variovorax saccharolyticus TaxID=3053516 RepID=UPI002576FD56|nr:helicase SNF2 [Variovorax sp. J31P216]MDM0025232.1 helicase SNF2 [Variovorax sp. J31P216]